MNILLGFSPLMAFFSVLQLVSPPGLVAAFLVSMFLCLSPHGESTKTGIQRSLRTAGPRLRVGRSHSTW